MPTHHDETILQRYQREHREYEESRMNKHTNGKLTVVDNSWEVSSIYDESRQCIALCHIYPGATEETQGEHEFRKEANARRLVASWNACQGIPTDDLEACPEGGLFHLADHANQLAIERDRLSAINAELLESLKGVAPYMEAAESAGLVGDEGCHWPVESVRAAIAKAQGEQQ